MSGEGSSRRIASDNRILRRTGEKSCSEREREQQKQENDATNEGETLLVEEGSIDIRPSTLQVQAQAPAQQL